MFSQAQDIGFIHFVGIGGIGMSGIAEVLHDLGYHVQGSDAADGYNIERLNKKNIRAIVGHAAENIQSPSGELPYVVVTSTAIKAGNAEVDAARAKNIPVIKRADMLAELMRMRSAIAVAGTHGKTTTTSLVGHMLEVGGLDPTVINGGIVHAYGTNTRLGKSNLMVVEADESDGSFTRLPATIAVVTNIDPEHMDHYANFDEIRHAFRTFVENIPFYGFAVLCTDHSEVQSLVAQISDRRIVTYGFNAQADVKGFNIRSGKDGSSFDVVFSSSVTGDQEETVRDLFLPMMGQHNVQNALVALAIARKKNVPAALMKQALSSFQGVKRRFTRTGVSYGVTIIDDYGHHPVEITAVLKAGRQALSGTKGKMIAVVQPHRYTRLASLFEEFCSCLHDADAVIIADVYAAGEAPIEGVNKNTFCEGLKRHGHKNVYALEHANDLPRLLISLIQPDDFVICLGAGNITSWAQALPAQLDTLFVSSKKAGVHG